MAAYAALVSVMHIIETIQNHPRPPISFDKEQLQSLTEHITFLQEFLETHSIDDDGLESRIADAAYSAEDVIESHIVDQIEASETVSSADFYDGLHKVIQDLDLIQRDMSSFAKKAGIKDDDQLLQNNYSIRTSHSSTGQDTAVGLDDVVVELMNKLTWNQSNLQIIPIVGMGGIGKTTLASNIYVNQVILDYFDLRGWATISQEYNSKEILLEILLCWNMGSRESLREMSENELGVKLHKSLCGRRYLIVLDDIWSIEAWDKVKIFFPDSNNGSAIMLTTRLSNVALELGGSRHEMSRLDEYKSWNLFCKSAFLEESCPRELVGIGKKIVENCKGLPLSIVVVGGLLAKSKRTQEYWLYIVENLNSVVNLQDDERCLKILHFSYKELPVHLKPCFLYMGMYPEDSVIHVPKLIRLWVAEGFLKPISGKCLEVVAKEYFNDLLAKNLILVNKRGYSGETIECKVHDLLLDLCIREAKKHKFLCVPRHRSFKNPNAQRRFAIHDKALPLHARKMPTVLDRITFKVIPPDRLISPNRVLPPDRVIPPKIFNHGSLVRSLACTYPDSLILESFHFRLLRVWVWNACLKMHILESSRRLVNCRYISGPCKSSQNKTIPSSISALWNLQTLDDTSTALDSEKVVTSEIWKMSQLRHVCIERLNLLDVPPNGHMNEDKGSNFVLRNLQTLKYLINFRFSGDVIKRIPNLKELKVTYERISDWSSYCLNNLDQLINLESLDIFTNLRDSFYASTTSPCPPRFITYSYPIPSLTFPRSLKELTLGGTKLDWGDMGTKIGSLPHLQVLILFPWAFLGAEWETVEGQFRNLKHLEICDHYDLMYWRTERWTHFPCLEHLSLKSLEKLKAIPSEIGETLKSIKMVSCSDSAILSAKEILMEQEGLGNESLRVQVTVPTKKYPDVVSLAAPNFRLYDGGDWI